MLAELGAAGVLKEKVDHKGLGEEASLERFAAGDRTLYPIQIRFAEEALKA
jgi:hypothetical protein